uniref:30S ribosomal protein S21 n=1 Tax=Haemonchus contortus TaxID=6289 RepID=A0A7I4XXL9_HAECO
MGRFCYQQWTSMNSTTGTSNIFTIVVGKPRDDSSKILELIRHRGIARATGNPQQTSKFAKLRREAIKENLKERREAVMYEAPKPESIFAKRDGTSPTIEPR